MNSAFDDSTNPYRSSFGDFAISATVDERTAFIRRTYSHLLVAILAFAGLEAILLQTSLPITMLNALGASKFGWLIVMAAFMGVSFLANTWAISGASSGKQYAGLGLYVVAEAIIFLPLLYIAQLRNVDIIPQAGIVTMVVFGGLTAVVFATKQDFSFLRSALTAAMFAMIAVVICSMIFGFSLGVLFVGAMILIACGYILYDTSNVLHHYRTDQHVAASLALFASVALLFWYVVRLFMDRD